jgi:hypothetical protein
MEKGKMLKAFKAYKEVTDAINTENWPIGASKCIRASMYCHNKFEEKGETIPKEYEEVIEYLQTHY